MSDNLDLINEYKDQVCILKQEVAELTDVKSSRTLLIKDAYKN